MVKVAAVQFGFKEAAQNMQRLSRGANDLTEPLEKIADDITEIEEIMFNSQGRRGGGMWRYPTMAWQRRKLRLGGDPRVGHFRRRLRRSLTYRGDPNMVLRIDGKAGILVFGSRLPYARTQQQHRPYLRFTPGDRKRFAQRIEKYVIKEWKGRARKRTGPR